MNEQFIKTLAALEAAENEMADLGNTLDSLERINQAQWHETQTVLDYCTRLSSMQNNIRVMLGKREKALLEGVRAQHLLHSNE
jgi:Fe-S cluster biosynthesis and repair protein YggX